MELVNTNAGGIFQSPLLLEHKNIVHGFGVRGVAISKYLDSLGINDRYIIETDQVHGDQVHLLLYPKKDRKLEGDAFISSRIGMVCFVRTADCVPIIMFDKKNNVVGAVHAGWRGTAKNIVKRTIESMKTVFDTKPEDVVAVIGPHICPKCFEAGPEVFDEMERLITEDDWFLNSRHMNLGRINYDLLTRVGVNESNIELSSFCTYCDSRFASWRRDKNPDERQFNFIMLLA